MRIAVLGSERAHVDLLCGTLSSVGHSCHAFDTGRELIRQLRRHTFDLLVLDWKVADMSGEQILRWVRDTLSEDLPVLFVTNRNRESDMTTMLNIGADDYLIRPVSPAVLVARVGSLLRRAYQLKPRANKEVFGEFAFDLATRHVTVRGIPVALTNKEFDLALLFFQHLNRPLSRTHILDVVWRQSPDVPSRTMDTHVSMLRSKLGLRSENGYRLSPMYGQGYRLERVENDELAADDAAAADLPSNGEADPAAP